MDTKAAAEEYLKKHNVLALLEELNTSLVYAKPADPVDHLINVLEQMKQARAKKTHSGFFTTDDFEGLFDLHDPSRTGRITADQASTALASLGLRGPPTMPEGVESFDLEAFKALARDAVATHRVVE